MKTNYFHKNISTIEKKEFWQNLLADFLEPTQLSIPRKSKNSIYKQIDIKISKHKTKQLDKFIQLYNLTLIDLMHAAWAVLLSKYSNTDNVIFGIYYNAQKVLPLRIQINNSLTFSGLLRHIKKLHQQLFKFGDINLQQIKTWLNLKNINLFSSMVNNTSSRFKNSGRKNINPPILYF